MSEPSLGAIAARELVESYERDRGFRLVFYDAGTKGPRGADAKGWTTREYRAADYVDGQNVGVLLGHEVQPGRFLVDVDFDWPEGVQMATALLPNTGFCFGHGSQVLTHALYTCSKLVKRKVYEDLKDPRADDSTDKRRTIVELRGTTTDGAVGLQTMVPPSTHPNGDVLRPIPEGVITHDDRIPERVALYATACLLLKHVGHRGLLHDVRLPLAGFLLQDCGVAETDAIAVGQAVAKLTGNDVDDVRSTIESTAKRLRAHKKVTAGAALARAIGERGEQVVAWIRKWLRGDEADHAIDDAIKRLNETHAVVWMQSGGLVVLSETREDDRTRLRFSRPSDMGLLYPEPVKVEGRTRSLGDAWVRHPQRRFYRGLELAPNGGNTDYYNMWKGFAVTPAKGEWPLFREHLHLVANKNEDHARYILAWMAKTVQEPHKPIGITLALKGKQGTGKSTFAKWFGALFGEHFLHLDSEQHLLGRFNSHLHNTIVLLADEAVWAGSKAGLGALKRMITEDTLNIERKGVDILPVKNMLHMIVASNEKWVVPTSFDNRRFAIFGTHDGHINDARFFASVEDELFNRGGLAALLYDLLEMSTDAVNLRQIPQTRDLQEQKVLSADPDEQWWVERLHQGYLEVTDRRNRDGEVVGKDYKWPELIEKDTLHASYLEFLNTLHRGGRSPKATETELGQFLQRRTLLHDRRSLIGGERVRVWIVPPLETCRRHWAEHNGMDDDYPWDD